MTRVRKPSGRIPLFEIGRSAESYKRKKGQRIPTRTILILCEGKETEPNYLNGIKTERRLRNVRIEIVPGGGDKVIPLNLVNTALERIESMDWDNHRDEAWCVFDVEKKGTNPTLKQAIIRAGDIIHLAISNPACEYWFLLHFAPTTREFINADDVIQALMVYLPNYHKSMDIYGNLKNFTHHGLSNALCLRKQSEHNWEDFPNPSTGIDKLVRLLFALA
jgi:hypothetical protein